MRVNRVQYRDEWGRGCAMRFEVNHRAEGLSCRITHHDLREAESSTEVAPASAPRKRERLALFSIISVWLSWFSSEVSMLADIGRFAQASLQGN
jgi:hypothetical protein